jgi:hypothetical protein
MTRNGFYTVISRKPAQDFEQGMHIEPLNTVFGQVILAEVGSIKLLRKGLLTERSSRSLLQYSKNGSQSVVLGLAA